MIRPWRLMDQNRETKLIAEASLSCVLLEQNTHRGGALAPPPQLLVGSRFWGSQISVAILAQVSKLCSCRLLCQCCSPPWLRMALLRRWAALWGHRGSRAYWDLGAFLIFLPCLGPDCCRQPLRRHRLGRAVYCPGQLRHLGGSESLAPASSPLGATPIHAVRQKEQGIEPKSGQPVLGTHRNFKEFSSC